LFAAAYPGALDIAPELTADLPLFETPGSGKPESPWLCMHWA
jgi:hypothetical protein